MLHGMQTKMAASIGKGDILTGMRCNENEFQVTSLATLSNQAKPKAFLPPSRGAFFFGSS
jgi:hypothetical protein